MGKDYQIRKMTLQPNRVFKTTGNESNKVEVFYSYIPSWQSDQWTGGKRVDIAVEDVIEIWLENGDYGLEPALGGYTIEHHYYAEKRNEPLPEPFLHHITKGIKGFYNQQLELTVLIVVLSILVIIIALSIPKK